VRRPPYATLAKLVLTAVALAALLVAGLSPLLVGVTLVVRGADAGWQQLPDLPEVFGRERLRSTVLAADGSTLAVLHDGENRAPLDLAQVPRHLIDAVLATEDRTFFAHDGLDPRGLARAFARNLSSGEVVAGGSTLSQQLVKNVVLDDALASQRSLLRKLTEIKLTVALERSWTKEEILVRYLNDATFGRGTYGASAAARFYFGKDVSELTLAESATLAGMLRSPEGNNPLTRPDNARARRDIVLTQMAETGAITAAEAAEARASELVTDHTPLPEVREPAMVEYAIAELARTGALGPDRAARRAELYTGGITVHTTVEPELTERVRSEIATRLELESDPSAAVVVLDPATGAIRAAVAGPRPYGRCPEQEPDCGFTQVNPALPGMGGSGRPGGSALKPVIAAAQLSMGVASTTRIDGSSGPVAGCRDGDREYRPGNYGGSNPGRIDLYRAMERSNNLYFARVTGLLGPEQVHATAEAMGVRAGALSGGCALSLGSGELFPLDLAAAYGTLAAGGNACPPHVIARIEDRDGKVIFDAEQDLPCRRGLDAGVAARVIDVLAGPVAKGGTAPQIGARFARQVIGKTGTTDAHRDAWFVGASAPSGREGEGAVSVAVWVGHDDPTPMVDVAGHRGPMTGGKLPAELFAAVIEPLVDPSGRWPTPPSESVVVPRLVGVGAVQAGEMLERVPLRPRVEIVAHWAPPGEVVSTSPAAGSRVSYLSEVVVRVSDGSVVPQHLPELTGLEIERARLRLTEIDPSWQVRVVSVVDPMRVGLVLEQRPAVGSLLPPGGTVTLVVGRAPQPPAPEPVLPSPTLPGPVVVPPSTPTPPSAPDPEPEPDLPELPEPPAPDPTPPVTPPAPDPTPPAG
jgi:penicillin-binding protein 1A